MSHSLEVTKRRRFSIVQKDITIPTDLQMCEPLTFLYLYGIVIPQLDQLDYYGNKDVYLGSPAQIHASQDPLIKNNVKKISAFLKKTITLEKDVFGMKEKFLESI